MVFLVPVAPVPISEPGVLYKCDACDSDITHTIRIKCAAPGCEEVDLCPSCFCAGKEVGQHKPWHDYRVVVRMLVVDVIFGLYVLWNRSATRIRYLLRTGEQMSE